MAQPARSMRRPVLVALAALVVVVAGVAAVLLVNRAGAGTPSASISPAPSGPARIGVYAFAAGTQYVDDPSQVITNLKAARFQPEGIDWVIGWRFVEPSPGQYDWTQLDNDLAS